MLTVGRRPRRWPKIPKRRPKTRRLAALLVLLGVGVLAYAAATVLWRDPVTDLYARWQQHELAEELEQTFSAFQLEEADFELSRSKATAAAANHAEAAEEARREAFVRAARRFQRSVELGEPLGRIVVPRLGLNSVFVHGTRWAEDLSRGPGHYDQTGLPAVTRTVALAGHRTTFGAPFRHIDELRRGDDIVLRLPYGAVHYEVVQHKIVKRNDWSILRDRGFDTLVLSACHPLYSAKQRWVVFARLSWVKPAQGERIHLWS